MFALLWAGQAFAKEAQFSCGPYVAPISGNAMNWDLAVGGVVGVRLAKRHIIEAQILMHSFADNKNQTSLAADAAITLDPILVETFDPVVSVMARYRITAFRGVVPGTKTWVATDLFIGAGHLTGTVELLGPSFESDGHLAVPVERYQNHTFAGTLGGAIKIFLRPTVALRLDVHGIFGIDQLLDFNSPHSAQNNRDLEPNANRLDCGINSSARCVTGFEAIHFVGFGLDFYLQGGK